MRSEGLIKKGSAAKEEDAMASYMGSDDHRALIFLIVKMRTDYSGVCTEHAKSFIQGSQKSYRQACPDVSRMQVLRDEES